MKSVELAIGDLRLKLSNGKYHVVYPTTDGKAIYTVAFIEPGEDGCDLRAVDRRPWQALRSGSLWRSAGSRWK